MIQTAGVKTKNHNFIRGPDIPPNAVKLNAFTLPNPYSKLCLSSKNKQENIDAVKEFLLEHANKKVKNMIEKGINAVKQNKPVVVVCTYGQHRSRAIAQMIGDSFHPSKVYYVHREN